MLSSIKQRLDREDEGFTLIELMVVVLIIAILLAIAIPTFLSARDSANSRAAESNLRNALTAEQEYYTNNQAFSATPASMSATENNLSWVTADATTNPSNAIVVAVGTNSNTDDTVFLGARGADGKCYEEMQINEATTAVPAGTYFQVWKPAAPSSGSLTCTFGSTVPTTLTPTTTSATAANSTAEPTAWYTSW
jgi:type IV pilus assembly protein PilA